MLKLATKFLPTTANFERAWNAGFRNAELYLDANVLTRVDEIIVAAQSYNLSYAMHFPNKPELKPLHLRACCRMYEALDVSAVVIHPPMMRRYGAAIREICPEIVLAVETMRVPPDALVAWVREQGSVTLDMEHIWKFSLRDSPIEDLFRIVREIFHGASDCVAHVHMPGYLPGEGEHRPMYTSREFCMGIFDILDDFSFEGLVVSEVDMQFQNPLDLQMDVVLFKRWQELRAKSVSSLVPKTTN